MKKYGRTLGELGMTSNEFIRVSLADICYFGNEKVAKDTLSLSNYISTENMIPDKGGVTSANSLPNVNTVSKYEKLDVLVSNIRPYFKKIWLATKNGGSSNDVLVIKNRDSQILDNKYLYYSLSNDDFFNYVTATSKGTKMPRGDKGAILKYEAFLPELDEQKAIANILSSLDEKIETNNQINKILEEMAAAIFKHWFVDFEFPNEDGEPYRSSGGEMVESEVGLIPKGWTVRSIEEITSLIIDHRGKTPKKLGGDWTENGYPAISAKNIKNNRIVKREDIKFLNKELYNRWMKDPLEEGDILMTSEAPLGECYYLGEVENYCLSQRLFAIRSNSNIISPALLYMSLVSENVIGNIKNRATGTTVTGIRQAELRKVPVIIPPLEIQSKITNIIENCLKSVFSNEKENEKLKNIRDTLLPKLMSGEIPVPVEE